MSIPGTGLPAVDAAGNLYGANVAARRAATPPQLPPARYINGRVRTFQDCRTIPDTTAAEIKIYIGPMPWHAVIMPNAELTHEALGSGVQLDLGADEAPDGILDGYDAAAAASGARLFDATTLATDGVGKRLFELLGLTEPPAGKEMAELYFTIKEAAVSGDSILAWNLPYTTD